MVAQLKYTENHLTVHMKEKCVVCELSQKSCFKKEVTNMERNVPESTSLRPEPSCGAHNSEAPSQWQERSRSGSGSSSSLLSTPRAGPGCAPATCHVRGPSIKAWPRFGSTSQHPTPAHCSSLPACTSSHWDHTAASSRAPAATVPLCTPFSTRWSGGSAKTY